MLDQLWSATVIVELVIALGVGWIVIGLSRHYSKGITSREMKADYLRTPTATTISVLGLVLPVLVALIAYLYTTRPDLAFGSLLATTIIYFCVLVLAIWETFAILKLADNTDIVKLSFPKDRRFMTAVGLMYAFLALGLFFFAYFFLFELSLKRDTAPAPTAQAYLIARPALPLNVSREEVLRRWGAPSRSGDSYVEFDTDGGIFKISFDKSGKAVELTHSRKK